MGLSEEYKSSKNKEVLINASFKMMKDKYNIDICNDNTTLIEKIINNILSTICNDIILLNANIKLNEVNNMTLVKIREYIEKNRQLFQSKDIAPKENEENGLLDDEELVKKLSQLEEKRKLATIILQNEPSYPSKSVEDDNVPNKLFDNNTTSITEIIDKISDVRKNIAVKHLIINSHNRDWYLNPSRNFIQFNINIDLSLNSIQPFKILFPVNVKNLTPYVIMHITDAIKIQKYNFIFSKNIGKWDQWELINNDAIDIIYLTKKSWKISFFDFMNNELSLGNDDINITDIDNSTSKDFIIKISNDNEHFLDLLDKKDFVLLKTANGQLHNVQLIFHSTNEYILHSFNDSLKKEDFINSKILNLKAQYSIILSYFTR